MKLPNRENAYVPLAKLTDYLLSLNHPFGRAKALLLINLGYDNSNANELERGLMTIARESDVAQELPSDYGTKYVIDGLLETPSGAALDLRTIWIIESGESRPRFVTAYPA